MINELKELLLGTGYFKDNEYLTAYATLINDYATDLTGYKENHHVIPAAVYKYKYKCKNGIEARKIADADEKNYMVALLYKDHVLAHYFLYFCTTGKVKSAMAKAVICMINNLEVNKLDFNCFRYLPAQFDEIQQLIDHIYADPNNNFYTPNEIDFLKQYYVEKGPQFCAEQLNKDVSSIKYKAHSLKLRYSARKAWSEEEILIIRQYYEQAGPKYCKTLLRDRPESSICSLARKLGLQTGRYWSDTDTSFLLENYSKIGGKKCAECLDRPYGSVRMKAAELNLIAVNAWSEAEVKILTENYSKGAIYCAEVLGRSAETVRVKANKLGLKVNK